MNRYRYEAADASGKVEAGHLEADSQSAAFAALRSRGLTALLVQVEGNQTGRGRQQPVQRQAVGQRPGLGHAATGEPARRQPAVGSGAERDGGAGREKTHRPDPAAVRGLLAAELRLADALAARPPGLSVDLPCADRGGGGVRRLAQVDGAPGRLHRGAQQPARQDPHRIHLPRRGGAGVHRHCDFLLSYVVPQVVSAFSQARQDLPGLTLAMLNASDFIRAWGWLCFAGIVGSFWGWRLYLRDPVARLNWHSRVLRLPLIGRFVLGLNTARFASTLAILGGAGVPLLRALEAARQTLSNERLSQCVNDATAKVREGVNLAPALAVEKVFPPVLIHLIASGEKTGSLPPMLERAAQTLSRDIERRAMGMTALLEPLMIVVMGAVVLVIVMAVLLPIIEINQLVT